MFALFRDSPQRRAALLAPAGAAERYALYGIDELPGFGFTVRHSLEAELAPARRHRVADRALNAGVRAIGGYGGDFATVLASAPAANAADVILSTVDTVGIPAVLLHRWQRLRRPLVYVAIGLPERLELLRSSAARRLYRGAFRRAQAIVTHGWAEKEALRMWLGAGGPRVSFVPFGVDVDAFRPLEGAEPDVDVVSIGADPRRDFALLVGVARRNPERSFRIIASAEHARTLSDVPRNVAVEVELPFALIHERLARARVVALPVRDNTYSGATTVLLQALATGRPVVVSRTGAIERGYGLVDRDTCRLVPPGDAGALESALLELLDDHEGAEAMGARARETAVRELSWSRYVEALAGLLAEAAGGVPA